MKIRNNNEVNLRKADLTALGLPKDAPRRMPATAVAGVLLDVQAAVLKRENELASPVWPRGSDGRLQVLIATDPLDQPELLATYHRGLRLAEMSAIIAPLVMEASLGQDLEPEL